MSEVAFKIFRADEWAVLTQSGAFGGSANDLADGFIHMSAANQVERTIGKYFADCSDLFIAAVDIATLAGRVKWEISSGGQLYPHLYGQLSLVDIIACSPVTRDTDGMVRLPALL